MQIDEREIERQFFESMRLCQVTPHEEYFPLIMDGNVHYFTVEGERYGHKSGRYYIHADGCPTWGIMDFHKHSEFQCFKFDFLRLDDDTRKEYLSQLNDTNYQAQIQARKVEGDKRKKEDEQQAILNAWREYHYPSASEFTERHPYLKAKHVANEHFIFFDGGHIARTKKKRQEGDICHIGELLFPFVSATTGEFKGLQRIFARPDMNGKYNRPFYSGTHYRGCCCELIPYSCRTWADPKPAPFFKPTIQATYGTWIPAYRKSLIHCHRSNDLETDTLFICEGIATGFAVLELTGNKLPVLCALSCNNILNVAQAWRKREPRIKIIIAADNDEAGMKAANETEKAGYADQIMTPPVKGFDWNDYLNMKKGHKKS